MSQVDLLREAKRAIRRNPDLSDADVARECRLGEHIIAGWTEMTPDLITIRAARREVENERPHHVDHGGGSGWTPIL